MSENELAKIVVDAACKIHEKLGPVIKGAISRVVNGLKN